MVPSPLCGRSSSIFFHPMHSILTLGSSINGTVGSWGCQFEPSDPIPICPFWNWAAPFSFMLSSGVFSLLTLPCLKERSLSVASFGMDHHPFPHTALFFLFPLSLSVGLFLCFIVPNARFRSPLPEWIFNSFLSAFLSRVKDGFRKIPLFTRHRIYLSEPSHGTQLGFFLPWFITLEKPGPTFFRPGDVGAYHQRLMKSPPPQTAAWRVGGCTRGSLDTWGVAQRHDFACS